MFHKHSRIFHIHSCDSSNKKNSSECFVHLPKVETVELLPLSPECALLGIPTNRLLLQWVRPRTTCNSYYLNEYSGKLP